jgi:hypothetical protein
LYGITLDGVVHKFREWLYLLGQGISDFLQNIGSPVTEAEKRKRNLKRYEEPQKRIGTDSASKPARQRVNEIESKQKLAFRARVASTVILAIALLASVAWIHRHLKIEERKKELIVQIELALGEQNLATAFQLLTGYTIEIDREDLLKDRRFRRLWDKTGALRDEANKSREKQERLAAEEQRLNTERRKQELIGISKNSEGDFRKMAVRELFQIDPTNLELQDEFNAIRKEIERERIEKLESDRMQQAEASRLKKIESIFSVWNGSHPGLVSLVKRNMKDPSSFDHVETKYWDMNTHLVVVMTYRGKNSFGALVLESVKAKIGIYDSAVEIFE